VLPVARVGGDPVDQVPGAPYGLLTLRWLMEEAGLGDRLPEGLQLTSLDHRRIAPSDARRLMGDARGDAERPWRPRPARRVELELTTSRSEDNVLRVAAYLAQDPELLYPDAGQQGRPHCMKVESEGPDLRDLAGAISALIARNDLDCPSLDD
jgi:hypothetical protein